MKSFVVQVYKESVLFSGILNGRGPSVGFESSLIQTGWGQGSKCWVPITPGPCWVGARLQVWFQSPFTQAGWGKVYVFQSNPIPIHWSKLGIGKVLGLGVPITAGPSWAGERFQV